MRLLPRTKSATWLLAVAVWLGLSGVACWVLPEQLTRRAVIPNAGTAVAGFGPDGRWLATFGPVEDISAPQPLRFWDTATGQPVHVLADEGIQCHELHVSPDGRWLLTVHIEPDHEAATLRCWDADTGAACSARKTSSPENSGLRFGPTGLLACAEDRGVSGRVVLRAMPTLEPVMTLDGAGGPLSFSADGRLIATGVWVDGQRGVAVWQVATGRELTLVKPSRSQSIRWPDVAALSPTGDRLIVAFRRRMFALTYLPDGVQVIDVPTGKVRSDLGSAGLIGVTADGSTAVVWDGHWGQPPGPQRLRPVDVVSGTERDPIVVSAELQPNPDYAPAAVGGHWLAVVDSQPSFRGRLIDWWNAHVPIGLSAGVDGPDVAVCDVTTGQCLGRVSGTDVFFGSTFSPDGRLLAVRGRDSAVDIWELKPRKPLGWLAAVSAMIALPLAAVAWRRSRKLRTMECGEARRACG